jgi:hypothetical protein
MNVGPPPSGHRLVSAAEIARLAGVTRAAVSNWRKRHPDYPSPVGSERNALFPLPEVRAWLDRHGKGNDIAGEVLLWQALRDTYGDDMVSGLADVAELVSTGSSEPVDPKVRLLAKKLAETSSPADVVAGLTERLTNSTGRPGLEVSTPRLVRAMRHFAGPVEGTVFDPACGIGFLLLAFGDGPAVTLAGQDIDAAAARLAEARARLTAPTEATITVGDSLRDDHWSDLRATLVVCDPPANVADWGREDLLLDARWEFGVPTRAEGELAWLQHCYAHVAPGGRALMVMPASVAYRKAGRRIRAEMVRRGVLTQVVALPPGMAAAHSQPVHLWLLARPSGPADTVSSVRMVDLTASDPDGPFAPASSQVADVPLIDLLDDTVDLTPTWHVAASRPDQLADYESAQDAIANQLRRLQGLLPTLAGGPGSLDGATITVADLARAGLVDVAGGGPVSTSDQLNTDYLQGFLRSDANVRRSTSGSFRTDIRGSRVPQMIIDDQHRYGAAFLAVEEFERQLRELNRWGERAIALARSGLTSGGLRPPPGEPEGDQADAST